MIAKAFEPIPGVTVFAAGVSNSREVHISEFERESSLLSSVSGPVVYFGSISVHGMETPYTKHKQAMERVVVGGGGLVIRLPIVVGKSDNPHTLANFLFDKISSGQPFDLQLRAHRHIVAVEDVADIARKLIASGIRGVVNLAYPRKYSVAEIVRAMEAIVGKQANTRPTLKGESYPVESLIHAPTDLQAALRTHYGDRCVSSLSARPDLREADASERAEVHAGRGVLTANG